jgi:hypothetical protein
MKKTILGMSACILILAACSKSDSRKQEENAVDETTQEIAKRTCGANELLEAQLKADPAFARRRVAHENSINKFISDGNARLINGVLEIPVVVNVLYRTTTENISLDQINSQIEVLNEDYNNTNPDITKVPLGFQDETGNVGIRFVLQSVVRKASKNRSWSMATDDMKKTAAGGLNPTDPVHNLNIWVVNKIAYYGQSLLGYAQFPGGPSATDGVVIGYNYFGRRGVLSAPYNKGRTATHEVGHWMNLNHIWGDETACAKDDNVSDTPLQTTENYGCPAFPKRDACTPSGDGVMFMNYMDYTNDGCMFMFTSGQAARMKATFFATNAPRGSFAQ